MPTNLGNLFSGDSGLSGALGFVTCSIFMLDPLTSTVPIEPVVDVVPGVTPFRVTLDAIQSESKTSNYRVTTNTLQDFSDTTSNVHQELEQFTVSGVMSSMGPMLASSGPLPTFGARLDLLRIANLERLAAQRRPVMVVTPRVSLARAFITGITRQWSPANGESTPVSISFIEARILTPVLGAALLDTDSLAAGNTATTGGGTQATSATDVPTGSPGATTGSVPTW
jgi:hypothetical protein